MISKYGFTASFWRKYTFEPSLTSVVEIKLQKLRGPVGI
jgi:hypothetical protein